MKNFIKQNWFKLGVLFVLLLAASAFVFYRQPAKTSGAVAITTDASDIDFQTKCATQAKLFFEDYIKTSEFGDPNDRQGDEYTNHFSARLNKCFILITNRFPYSVDNADVYKKDLYDAAEKKQYGVYRWWIYKDKPAALGACRIFPNGNANTDGTVSSPADLKDMRICNSEAEFDTLVKGYMES